MSDIPKAKLMGFVLVFLCLLSFGCGYETLPLSKNSALPAFIKEISDAKDIQQVYFCWSDCEIAPFFAMPHVRVEYISTNGMTKDIKIPITASTWVDNGRHDQQYITVLKHRQLFEDVPDTAPKQLRVVTEESVTPSF
jgi:hypothetical protein